MVLLKSSTEWRFLINELPLYTPYVRPVLEQCGAEGRMVPAPETSPPGLWCGGSGFRLKLFAGPRAVLVTST